MNGFYNSEPIINKEILLFFGIGLSFTYRFI